MVTLAINIAAFLFLAWLVLMVFALLVTLDAESRKNIPVHVPSKWDNSFQWFLVYMWAVIYAIFIPVMIYTFIWG